MIRSLIVLLFILAFSNATVRSESVPVETLRKIFHSAVLDASLISSFVNEMDKIKDPTPIELAYKAAAEALKAQNEWNPLEKILYLKKFHKMIGKAVKLDVNEIEIRFLRFGIEYNIPSILGFSNNMLEDKSLIINSVSKIERFDIEEYFGVFILTLLSDSGMCSPEELALVKSKIESASDPIGF